MRIFDTHAHYDSSAFASDRDEILTALPQAGVELVVDPGCDVESSRAVLALAERYPHVYAAVGLHPEDCAGAGEAELEEIRRLCGHEKAVAIGEIGLDYYWAENPPRPSSRRSSGGSWLWPRNWTCRSLSMTGRPMGTRWPLSESFPASGACSTAIPAVRKWRRNS